jgi:hypothetical protein
VLQPTFTEIGINIPGYLTNTATSFEKTSTQLAVLPTYYKFLFSIGFQRISTNIVKPFANITPV